MRLQILTITNIVIVMVDIIIIITIIIRFKHAVDAADGLRLQPGCELRCADLVAHLATQWNSESRLGVY